MVALMEALAPVEGFTPTALNHVRLLRSNRPLSTTPALYEPGIVFVCQGSKLARWGDRSYRYDAQHFLAVAVPVPFTMETRATPERPLLAIYLTLDIEVVADLVAQLDGILGPASAEPTGMLSSPMDPTLRDSVVRLLKSLHSPTETVLLAPAIVREIYFRVLTSRQGLALRAALARNGRAPGILRAVRIMHETYRDRLDVESLAARVGMSPSTFHLHFKDVTRTSPLRYLKSIRLHKARLLMLRERMTAAAAAAQVGYSSPSQFSREFARFFGRSPAQERQRLRSAFAMPEMPWAGPWISSH